MLIVIGAVLMPVLALHLHLSLEIAGIIPQTVDQLGGFLQQAQWPLEFEYMDKTRMD